MAGAGAAALEAWAARQGALGGGRVALGASPRAGEGVGALAVREIAAGDLVLSVPAPLLLDACAAARDEKLAPFLERHKLARPGGFYASVEDEAWPVILLLALRAHEGPRSPYLDALPREGDLHAATCWTADELETLLPPGHEVRRRAVAAQSEREVWAKRALAELGIPASCVHWAASMFYSRALRVPLNSSGQRAETSAMVPYLDSLNHRAGQLHTLEVSPEGHVLLRAGQSLAAGDPVYINYGAKSNVDLFLHYGFVGPSGPEHIAFLEAFGHTFKVSRGTPELFVFPAGLLDVARAKSDCSPVADAAAQPPYQGLDPDDEDWVLFFSGIGAPSSTAEAEAAALAALVQVVSSDLDARASASLLPEDAGQVCKPRAALAAQFAASEIACLDALLAALRRLANLVN